jgi:hypothetical protein
VSGRIQGRSIVLQRGACPRKVEVEVGASRVERDGLPETIQCAADPALLEKGRPGDEMEFGVHDALVEKTGGLRMRLVPLLAVQSGNRLLFDDGCVHECV